MLREVLVLIEQLEAVKSESEQPMFTTCWEVTGCSLSDYMACQAFQQRKNCYELDRVVCCTKHRDNCPTCAVYIAVNKVPVQKMRVRISTDRFDVVGTVHIPVGMRLSDYLNKNERQFVVVTDGHITSADQSIQSVEDRFVVVGRSHIVMAYPLDEA